MLEQKSAPAGAEKKYTSPFVFDDVQGPANWREGISAPVPTKHTDLLALQYPRYATQLNEARGEGYTDEEILQFLGGREAEALLYYPIVEVNSFLGRTGKTMQEAAQTRWDSQRAAYAKITGKSEEDVEERMRAGQLIGVPASTLLIDDALYEKLTPHIKKTEAWTETLANGVRLENVERQISDIGYRLMTYQNVPDWEKQIEALEAQQQALQPALMTGGLVRAGQGAIKTLVQMGNTSLRALPYAGAGAAVGGLTGQALGGTVLTPTGLATGMGGAMTGFATGMAFGSTLEMFKMEAGSAYLDLIRTKDKDGHGMDPTLARGAALGIGLINAALENLQLKTVIENIPGGRAALEALKGGGAKRLMNVPTIRGALLKLGKEKLEDITEESFQEMAQEIVPIVAGELAKAISGREFEHVSVEDAVNQVLSVGKETAQSMALMFTPGAVVQGIGMVRDVQQAKSGADVATGATEATPETPAMAADGEAAVQGHPVDGLGKNAEPEAEGGETSVYLPVAALEQYAQTHPGELEDLGVDLTPLEGMDEVRLTEAQFASLSEELPELAEAVRNDVRRGAKGTTAREAGEIVLRRTSKPAARTAEAKAVAEELEQQMLAVGKDREEARAFAQVGASVAEALARRANISVSDAMRLTLRRGEDARQGAGFAQPANAGVDLGQKVPVLDLSGAEGTSTTKELLTRLKDMALKDETWISRDAEVFATLPGGKKLKHVAYSSRKGDLRQRSNIASGLDELVQNAVLIESVPNNDPKKADVLNFHRLYVPVRTDAGVQAVRIVAEELKDSDRLRPTDVELYDVVLEGQKESPAVNHGLLAEEVVPSPGAPSEITIADMLRGVKDAEGRPYVGEEYRQSGQLSLFGEDGTPTLEALSQQKHLIDRLNEKPVEQWTLDEIVAFEEFEDKFNVDKPSTWGAPAEDTKKIKKLRAQEEEMEDLDGYEFEDNVPSTWDGSAPEVRQRASVLIARGSDITAQEYSELRTLQMAAEDAYRRDFRRKHIDPDGLLDLYDPQKLKELLYKVSRKTEGEDLTLEDEVTSKGQFQHELPDTGDWVKYPIFIKKRKGERVFEVQDDTGRIYAEFDNEIRARYFAQAAAVEMDKARETLRAQDDFVPPSQAILDAFDRNDPTTWGSEQLQSEGIELLSKLDAANDAEDDDNVEKYDNMFHNAAEAAENLLIDKINQEQWAHEDDLENNPFHGLDVVTILAGVDAEPYKRASKPSLNAEVYNQSAYHGSPHRGIKKMSLQHIGTGEGNQAYGWGIYSAEARGTAEFYRKNLSVLDVDPRECVVFSGKKGTYSFKDGAWVIPGGKKVPPVIERLLSNLATGRLSGNDSLSEDVAHIKEVNAKYVKGYTRAATEYREKLAELEASGKDWCRSEQCSKDTLKERLADVVRRANESQMEIDWLEVNPLTEEDITQPPGGQLYRLEVPENDVLLDWSAPLSEQPEKVKAAIREIAAELTPEDIERLGGNTDMLLSDEMEGKQFYAMLAWLPSVDSEKAASMLLLKHGIPGLRYWDSQSRLDGEGTHNFVVWDEDAMSIEETYYQQHGPLTFKLTGKPVSGEYMAALEKLEAGKPVTAEEYDAIPEIQDARGRTATGSTLDAPNREPIRKQVYDKLMSYGSAVTEIVDGREQTVYNGEVRNDRRADIIIGLPASGKSSALVDPISSKYKSMLIDSDEAKKLIPEFDDGFGAGYVHEESKAIVSRVYEDATNEGRNVVIPIVGSDYAKLERGYINILRQKGYKVYVHMADIDPNVAAGRNLRRFAETGRFVDLEATSFKYGNKPREVFEKVKKEGVSDGYSRIDTTVFPGKQVEGTEDISYDRGDLREGRGRVLQRTYAIQGRESGRGTAEGLEVERAGGTSREGMAPRSVSARPSDINARLTVQPDGMSLIEFFESANRSTSFHELAHHVFRMLDELSRAEGADPQLRADVDEVLRHAGVTREDFDSEDAEVRRQARTQAHEYFAQGFETYIAEGKAPSRALRGVFRRLRAWMIEVYHDVVQALGIELSPEMRDIYARLLATDEEITAETTVQELAVEDAAIHDEIRRCQAELRERSEQEQLGYEAPDEWSFYEVPEDAEEAVTGWLGQLEEYEFKRNAHEAVQNVARLIRENGGLRFGDFIEQLGEDLARDVRKRWPGLFRNTTEGPQLALDVLTETLQAHGIDLDVQGLVNWLQENVNEVVKKPAPLVEVNADTLNALVEHLGVDGAREYMTDRQRYLTRLQKALQAEYDQDKNNAQVKADLEATYREQREIAESVKALDRTLSAEGDVVPERTMEPVTLGTESGRSIDEADSKELLYNEDGSPNLGEIDEETAAAAGIQAGVIQANVGAVRHAEEGHGGEILGSGYPDVATFFFDVLSGYERVYRGSNDSLLLTKPLGGHHAVAAIELVNEDGVYRAKTGWTIRERKLNKKELLFARSEPLATDPGAGVVSRTGPDGDREGTVPTAKQKSNSAATVSPGRAGVNTMLTLSEAMRRGYAMAEKYSKAAWRQGVKEGRAAVEARIAALKQKLKERQEAKAEVVELVKGINRMAGSETVTWAAHKEIEQLLSSYDLKRRSKKTLEHRAEVAQWLREDPELAEALNEKDTAHLGETTLNEMTLDDLRALNDQVQQIYDRGAEEYRIWDLERTERKDTIYTDLRNTLEKRKVNLPKVVTGPEDLKKQYKGLTGKAAKAKDWTYAVTLAKDRFFDWLDHGRTGYRGPFVKYFVDMTAAARDESLRHIQDRRKWVEMRLRELGFRVSDFARIATTYNGKDYTWSQIQEIYMGLRNEKKAQAILNGNFKNSLDASGDAAYLVSLLSEEHKRAAELVAEDHNRNVDRVEAGMIAAYQKGMERETDYTSIHRLERVSSMGLIDAESDEALLNGLSNADVLRRVEDGFMKKRVAMKAENQTPIYLGLWENWHSDVARHEHAAAMAVTARDLAGALLTRDPKSGKTLGRMIKERFGDEAWHTLVSFFNDDVMDDTRLAHNVLDRLSSALAKNMSIAYLAGNLSTVLKQTTSIPRFLITAGPHRMLVSLGHFLLRGSKFLEEVYTMDPQLRERNGSPLLTMIREDPQWGKRMVQRGLDWLLEPISMVDRWVAAIGWKATYDANVKKLGHEGAVREAQRAVRLTQQPVSARDTARMWRQNGFVRLAMVFTSDAASTFGMTAYDLVQQIRGGKLNKAFMTLTALTITAILMKAANEGVPDDEDDDEEGRNWALEAFIEQAIASIPLAGKEAMVLYDSMRGKYRGTQYSAIMAPIVKLGQAYHLLSKEDSDEEEQRRATWLALEAFSLSGVAPIPVTGMRRIVQSFDLAKEDGMAAALNLVGIRRRPE